MLFQTALCVHFIALFLLAGGSLCAFIAEKHLWRKVEMGSPDAKVLLPVLHQGVHFIRAGFILFFISGVAMLWALNFAYLHQGWFWVKFALFIALPVRGALIADRLVEKIGWQLELDRYDGIALEILKKKMTRFFIVQYLLVGAIIGLVVFKP